MNLDNVSIRINGIQASELVINTFAAALYDVPVLLVTGDLGVCEQAKRLCPAIYTVPVSRGCGNRSLSSSGGGRQTHSRKSGDGRCGRHCPS